MKSLRALALCLLAGAANAGTLTVSSIVDPNLGSADSGLYVYDEFTEAMWTGFGATAGNGTLVMTGFLSCFSSDGCPGQETPPVFTVHFAGSGFSTVDIVLEGVLQPSSDQIGIPTYLMGQVRTVIYDENAGGELPAPVIDIATDIAVNQATNGKVTLASHPATGLLPANFYGSTSFTIQALHGNLNFTDPLTNTFATQSEVPEPSALVLLGLGLPVVALLRRR